MVQSNGSEHLHLYYLSNDDFTNVSLDVPQDGFTMQDLYSHASTTIQTIAMGDFINSKYWDSRPPELPDAKVGRIVWI